MQYTQATQKRDDDTDVLFSALGVFWAFSNEQFKDGLVKANLAPNEKLVSIGAGGYIPSKNVDALIQGNKEIKTAFKEAMQDAKTREAHILYEINNHEAYYTGTIEDTLEALGDDYTAEEVQTVYRTNYKNND